jgi:O-antigen ligase
VAALQLGAGWTDAPFLTLHGLQFWWGSLLLLPLLRDGLAEQLQFQRSRDVAALCLLLLFLVSVSVGLTQTLEGSAGDGWALWWPFLYRNHLAAFVVLLLPLLLRRWEGDGKGRWVALAAATVGSMTVLASGSRGGAVLVAVAWMLGMLWRVPGVDPTTAVAACDDAADGTPGSGFTGPSPIRRRGALRGWAVVALAVAGGIGALAAAGGTAVLEYRIRHWSPLLEGRLDYWRASVEMIAQRPLVGWGFGMWPDVYRQFLVYDSGLVVNRAHSDWLEWTAEGGLVVVVALGWLLWGALRRAMQAPWAWGLPLLLLYGMVDYTLRAPLVWVAFLTLWMAAAPKTNGKLPRAMRRT